MQHRKSAIAAAIVGVSALGVFGSANAAVPAEATAAFTTLASDFSTMEAAAWPVVALVVGGFIVLKLFKRFARSAT